MFKRKKKAIDCEIERVLAQLSGMQADSEQYRAAVMNLKVLYNARSCKTDSSVGADTVVMAVTNLAGILLVLNYEQVHVVSSKAIGFILKGRV